MIWGAGKSTIGINTEKNAEGRRVALRKSVSAMKIIENKTFDEERALYGSRGVAVKNCRFDGPADGESAFKESADIAAEDCFFNLRYPFWHNRGLSISRCEMTDQCRAALWYSKKIDISQTKLHGIKALRECRDVRMKDCDTVSPEFGWSSEKVWMQDCSAESEYIFLRAKNLVFRNVRFKGKYSFQYVENVLFENCAFETKDAFWHSKNVTAKNCSIRGEYLTWYSDRLTLIDCDIFGTQPFCYCKKLRLIDCRMYDADLCFEKSEVRAELSAPLISIKNPKRGVIRLPAVGQVIRDDPSAKGKIESTEKGGESA